MTGFRKQRLYSCILYDLHGVYILSDVVSVRVPRELKEKMKKYLIDWSDEIRRFLEERIKVLEFLELLDNIEGKARKRRRTRIDSVKIIREEREKR